MTPSDLNDMQILPDEEAAEVVTARARFIDRQYDLTFAEMGMLACYVEERELWKVMKYGSQNEWIADVCPKSRSTWFDAKRRWKELADVPATDKIEMPRGNLIVMQRLSTAVRTDPTVIAAAKGMPQERFVETVARDYPDEHLEAVKSVHIKADVSAAKVIEEAIRLAMRLGANTRAEAMEEMAVEFIDQHRDDYDAMF